MSHYKDLSEMLRDAISDGGRVALQKIESEARAADELEITFWCYSALAAWGAEGLEKIVQVSLDGDTVKCKSAALTLLAALAVTGRLPKIGVAFLPSGVSDAVEQQLASRAIRPAARQALRRLVLSVPTDDLLIPLSQSMMHMQLAEGELAAELVSALSARWLRFGPTLLDRYETLLIDEADDEAIFQEFFCDYPQLLDPMAVQVWSRPDFHGALEPDFVVRRADDSYLVIEIECPSKLIIASDSRLSHQATHAEAQALEYEDFLSARVVEATTHFPNYRRADCLTVIGLERTLNKAQRGALDRANGRRQNSRIVGFDWLLERARAVVSNIGDGRIEVTRGYRII